MTECTQQGFTFEGHFSRQVVAEFSGDRLTTEGGALLLREADRKIGLLRRVADCFTDTRQPERVEHRLPEMLAQRIYGLALGYEDLNDHEQLRSDPLWAVLAGKQEIEKSLAGKSTLNRLELTPSGSPLSERCHKIGYSPAAIDELLVKIFLQAHTRAPKQIVRRGFCEPAVPKVTFQVPYFILAIRLGIGCAKGRLRVHLQKLVGASSIFGNCDTRR